MVRHHILYSTNSWLGYLIAERYYGSVHYVWCTPYFDSSSLPRVDATTPPTSTPCDIYHSLAADVAGGDRHSAKIAQNKVGILHGAGIQLAAGVITADQKKDITTIVEGAQIQDFKPCLYVIPHELVLPLLHEVPVEDRAHPMSVEYIIEKLPRSHFDVIELTKK